MKKINLERMEKITGGSCWGAFSGFTGMIAASMFGPAGIVVGAASFAYMIRQSQTCDI